MVKGQRQGTRKSANSIVKELDAAIAMLTRARALAASNNGSPKAVSSTSQGRKAKRTLSAEAREAIAAAQRKRWAKVRRQKKFAQRGVLGK